MVLSGNKKVSSLSSITNANQGGGSKKAGLRPSVGETAWNVVFYRNVDPINGKCCGAAKMAITMNPNVRQSRPISTSPMNWN